MILVFGGTTEGRIAAKELEESGSKFFYSTHDGFQQLSLHNGVILSGAMDEAQMESFCQSNGVRLIIDAAHPFASELHGNINKAGERLNIPVIRFERIYPTRDSRFIWCNTLSDAITKLSEKGDFSLGVKRLLSTAGVKSIPKLKVLKDSGIEVYHRILDRESSLAIAKENGVDEAHLCYYSKEEDPSKVLEKIKPDAILLKESGLSGGFIEKAEAALKRGIKIFAIEKPALPEGFIMVNGPYGMRRMVEKLLPEFYPLHSGLTTGSCATAATLAAATSIIEGTNPSSVDIFLPDGESINVDTLCTKPGSAYVVKDSGDDPDVTDKMEIHADVELLNTSDIEIDGGEGVGRITLPGFDFPPGSAAINKGPRKMIEDNLRARFPNRGFKVTISVPGGEDIAHRTFNPRLGIEGGISIIGVSGIIKPFSEEGFINSVKKCMEVAKASQSERVVINSGAKSEGFLKEFYKQLPPQAFVQYGNKIGDTISIAYSLGFKHISLGIMLGKAVKLAAGNLDTHSSSVTMDRDFICSLLKEAGCREEIANKAYTITLARELWDIVPAENMQSFVNTVIAKCRNVCSPLCPNAELTVLLISEEGTIFF